jgi:hypothetical protein
MAFSDVSTGHKDAVGTLFKSLQNIRRNKHSRTHEADQANAGRVLHTPYPGKVRTGVGTPVAREGYDLGMKFLYHVNSRNRGFL